MQARAVLGIAFAAAIAAAAGCGVAPSPTPEGLPTAGLAKLDVPSRRLLAQLDAGEWTIGELAVSDAAVARRLAAQRGLEIVAGGPDTVTVLGSPDAILRVGLDPSVAAIVLREDARALRPVARPLAGGIDLPTPGPPYADGVVDIPPDSRDGEVRPDLRTKIIDALSDAIVTVDGRPYTIVQSVEGCEPKPVSCHISLTGRHEPANLLAAEDTWSAEVTETAAGVEVTTRPEISGSMPRWLAREAERIARSDSRAAPAIAAFRSISAFRWSADPSLLLTVVYARPCAATSRVQLAHAAAGPRLAETGSCDDLLEVTVDPAKRTVTSLSVTPGP